MLNLKSCSAILILLQITLAILLLFNFPGYLEVRGVSTSDGPSYINYPWESLKEVLGSHRNFAYPLFLKCVFFLFNDYSNIPAIQTIFYFTSIAFLFYIFRKYLPNYVLSSFVFCSFLIWHKPLFPWLTHILTEGIAATLLNFCLAFLIIAYKKDKLFWYLLLALFSFMLFQVRTAFVFACLLFPFWILSISWIGKKNKKDIFLVFIKTSIATISPVIIYALLRLLIVDQFGIAPLNGILLSGHASTFYTDADNDFNSPKVKALSGLIEHKKKFLRRPCNSHFIIENDNYPVDMHSKCYFDYVMTNWLSAIEILDGEKPFDDYRNDRPWNYAPTLSPFFSRYTVEHDRLLMEYSIPIIKSHYKEYFSWVYSGIPVALSILKSYRLESLESVKIIYENKVKNVSTSLICLIFYAGFFLGILLSIFRVNLKSDEVFLFTLIGFSFFVTSLAPVLFLNTFIVRFFDLHTIYLFPSLCIFTIYLTQLILNKLIVTYNVIVNKN
jgi:hypothetical protein